MTESKGNLYLFLLSKCFLLNWDPEYSMGRKRSSPVSVRKLSAMFSGKSEAEVAEAMREMVPRQSAGR